jgi:hypothetical protein
MLIRFFSSTELLKGDAGTVTVDLDGDGNPNYLLNPLLAELGAHVRMINLAGIDASVLTCGSASISGTSFHRPARYGDAVAAFATAASAPVMAFTASSTS